MRLKRYIIEEYLGRYKPTKPFKGSERLDVTPGSKWDVDMSGTFEVFVNPTGREYKDVENAGSGIVRGLWDGRNLVIFPGILLHDDLPDEMKRDIKNLQYPLFSWSLDAPGNWFGGWMEDEDDSKWSKDQAMKFRKVMSRLSPKSNQSDLNWGWNTTYDNKGNVK